MIVNPDRFYYNQDCRHLYGRRVDGKTGRVVLFYLPFAFWWGIKSGHKISFFKLQKVGGNG